MNKFHRSQRLLTKTDYDAVFNTGKKCVTSEFIIFYRSNTAAVARLGLAISKKAVSKAHERNRIKRLLRETFRTTTLSKIDVVVLAKRGIEQINNVTLITQLNKVWSKLA